MCMQSTLYCSKINSISQLDAKTLIIVKQVREIIVNRPLDLVKQCTLPLQIMDILMKQTKNKRLGLK